MIVVRETSTLKKEVAGFCETLIHSHTTQRHTHKTLDFTVAAVIIASLLFLLSVYESFFFVDFFMTY